MALPILWRYLLSNYLKVFTVCCLSILFLLTTTRLKEVARFATMGPEGEALLYFLFYQMVFLLPIALPLSCVVSAVVLFQNLSDSHQLTAMRACGLSMRQITAPILVAAACLSLLNSYVVSEWSTESVLASRFLKNKIKSMNPMILLESPQLLRSSGFYVEALGPSVHGESASDLVLSFYNSHQKRLHLVLAKKVEANDVHILGKELALIGGTEAKLPTESYDNLAIENVSFSETPLEELRQFLGKDSWNVKADYLRFSLLLVHIQEFQKQLAATGPNSHIQEELERCYVEIPRRLSTGLAVFALTLMASSFAMTISRYPSKRGILMVLSLTTLYLFCFFAAKRYDIGVATALYIVPLALIIFLSIRNLNRLSQGIE